MEKSVSLSLSDYEWNPAGLTRLSREAWRYTGPFTRYNRFKGVFPGLGTATVAFAAYCAYEALFMKDEHHGHEPGYGSEGQH